MSHCLGQPRLPVEAHSINTNTTPLSISQRCESEDQEVKQWVWAPVITAESHPDPKVQT